MLPGQLLDGGELQFRYAGLRGGDEVCSGNVAYQSEIGRIGLAATWSTRRHVGG